MNTVLNQDTLELIEKAAYATMPPSEIAQLIGMTLQEFKEQLMSESSVIYRHYHMGKKKARLLVYEQTLEQAKLGNIDALKLMSEHIDTMSAEEI